MRMTTLAGLGTHTSPAGRQGTIVVVVLLDVLLDALPTGSQAQASVHRCPGRHPTPRSHCSPPPRSTTPSPQVERTAVKGLRTFDLGAVTMPFRSAQPCAIVPVSRTRPLSPAHRGQRTRTIVIARRV